MFAFFIQAVFGRFLPFATTFGSFLVEVATILAFCAVGASCFKVEWLHIDGQVVISEVLRVPKRDLDVVVP